MRKMIFLLSFGVVVPSIASAQSVGALKVGARIEVTPTRGVASTGAFSSAANDSLSFVRNDATATRVLLPFGQIKALRVSNGRSRLRSAGRGALIGSLVGVGVGVVSGATTSLKPRGDCFLDCTRSQAMTFAGIFFGGVGAIGGTIYGAVVNHENWTAVDLGRTK